MFTTFDFFHPVNKAIVKMGSLTQNGQKISDRGARELINKHTMARIIQHCTIDISPIMIVY